MTACKVEPSRGRNENRGGRRLDPYSVALWRHFTAIDVNESLLNRRGLYGEFSLMGYSVSSVLCISDGWLGIGGSGDAARGLLNVVRLRYGAISDEIN